MSYAVELLRRVRRGAVSFFVTPLRQAPYPAQLFSYSRFLSNFIEHSPLRYWSF